MSSNHTLLTKLALLFAMVGALMLAGCGGDDNGGLSADDMARIENAEAAAATARAEATAAAAAQATAEAEAATATAAQATAEAEAATAMAAEAAAKAAQATAEANATAAVAAQAVAESEAKMAMAAQTKAEADLEAAQTAVAAANEAKTMAETAKAVAESEARAAQAAQMVAVAAQEKAETAQKAAETAKMAADTALKTAQDERDKYKMMYEEATDVDTVGTTVGAAGRAQAARIANSVTDAVKAMKAVGETLTPAKQARMAMTKRGVSVKKLKNTGDGLTFNVDQGTLTQLKHTDTAEMMALDVSGYTGTALEKTSGGVMQEALIYTDVEKSITSFSAKYPYTHRVTIAADGAVGDEPATLTSGVLTHFFVKTIGTDESIAITGTSNTEISFEHGLSSDIPSRTLDDTPDVPGGARNFNPTTIRGSYDGVDGQYVCAGDCILTWSSSATGPVIKVTTASVGTDIYFAADDRSELLPDPDYLTFGVWMMAQDGPAAAGLIRPIAMAGADAFESDELARLNGSATYEGQATGYYATRAGGSAEANSGRFTASAMLTANFDTGMGVTMDADNTSVEIGSLHPTPLDSLLEPEAVDGVDVMYFRPALGSPGTIKGKIDKFMAEDGTMMGGWVVNLGTAGIRPIADVMVPDAADSPEDRDTAQDMARTNAAMATMLEGATAGTGYAMEWTGVWDATFHGTNMTTAPTGVVGTFQATAGMANPVTEAGAIDLFDDPGFAGVVGSFGAKKK